MKVSFRMSLTHLSNKNMKYLSIIIVALLFASCLETIDGNFGPEKSPDRAILELNLLSKVGDTSYLSAVIKDYKIEYHHGIGDERSYINAYIWSNYDLMQIYPKTSISAKSSIIPANYEITDFSSLQQIFTVTAEDGQVREWEINVQPYEIPDSIISTYCGKWLFYKWEYYSGTGSGSIDLEGSSDDTLVIRENTTFQVLQGPDNEFLLEKPENKEWLEMMPKSGNWSFSEGLDVENQVDEVRKIDFYSNVTGAIMHFEKVLYPYVADKNSLVLFYYPQPGYKVWYKMVRVN